eukprot:jgi/Picre1/32707/NNA_008052.t1
MGSGRMPLRLCWSLARDPMHTRSLMYYATLQKEAKKFDVALEMIEKAYNTVCMGDDSMGGKDGWEDKYRKSIELCPRHAPAHYNLGVAAAEADDMHKAIEWYQRAVEIHPDMVVKNLACIELVWNRRKDVRGDLQEAIRLYEKAVSILPTCVEALYNLGMKGQMHLALTSYEAALEARPDFPQGLNNVAVMYTQQGKASMAFNVLQAAIMADQTYAEAWNNLGVLQRDVGEAQRCLGELQEMLRSGASES